VPARILASVRSVDPLALGACCDRLLDAGADGLHVDLCDGVFVPELTLGPEVVRALAARVGPVLDVHLMVARPEDYLRVLADAGATRVSFHLEASPYPWRLASLARTLGLEVGIALNPVTPVAALEPVARTADFVNLLTTEVDFAGERLLLGSVERVAAARALLPPEVGVEVDGGVDAASASALVRAGADELVVGRAISCGDDWRAAVAGLRRAIDVPAVEAVT
jgi:ribulose-phosphate 3-epimerase